MLKERKIIDLIDSHFDALSDKNVIDLNDGYSRILGPIFNRDLQLTSIYTEIASFLVNNGIAKFRHINYYTFYRLFELINLHISEPKILETGSSAYGTNSSMLFAKLVHNFGGRFDTVDLNSETFKKIHNILKESFGNNENIKCHNDDSVQFIKSFNKNLNVVYLDSYDLIPGHFDRSAEHGLQEFQNVLKNLENLSYILIDDTPKTIEIIMKVGDPELVSKSIEHKAIHGSLPGKGELVLKHIEKDNRFRIVDHQYQLLIEYKN